MLTLSAGSRRIGIASLLLLAATACSRSKGPEAQAMRMMDAVPVSVVAAQKKTVPVQLTGIGNVEAYSTVSIKSQVGGELLKVNFIEGQEVAKGALLFEIDPLPFQSDIKRAEANVARDAAQQKQAEENLARDTAQAKNAVVERQRYQQLVEKGIIAKDQYDSASTNAEALEAAVRADHAAIENARQMMQADKAALETAKIQLGYCTIRAPIEGRTGSLMVHQGNIVKANDVPMVVINRIRPIYVSFAVPEQNLADLKKYMSLGKVTVEAAIPNDRGEPEKGVLSFMDNAVDAQTGTIRLKATYQNESKRLWPGQFVNVTLNLSQLSDAVVVPNEAVQTGQSGPFVFVVKPDLSAESRPVTPGRVVAGETVIERGLQPGERVVTDGQLRLVPGAKVQIKEAVGGSQERS